MIFNSNKVYFASSLIAKPNLYGTENEIWAGFGQVGITEKKMRADYEQLLRMFFLCFQGQKNNLKFFKNYCSVHTKKLHQIKMRKPNKFFKI